MSIEQTVVNAVPVTQEPRRNPMIPSLRIEEMLNSVAAMVEAGSLGEIHGYVEAQYGVVSLHLIPQRTRTLLGKAKELLVVVAEDGAEFVVNYEDANEVSGVQRVIERFRGNYDVVWSKINTLAGDLIENS